MNDAANQSGVDPSDVLTLEGSKALIGLCRAGKLYEVEEWIKAGRSLQVAPSVRKSPIEVAIETGFHSLIVCLVRNESQIAVKNRALIAAVENRKLDLIELLVSHGAEVGAAPFLDVLRSWDPRIMRFFLERGVDVITGAPFANAFGEKIRTSLRTFVEYKKANPQLVAALQEQVDRALRHFCCEGDLKWISLLLWAGANPRSRGPALDERHADDPECYTTAIEEACTKGNVEVLRKLKPDNTTDHLSELLASAAFSRSKEVFSCLLALGANPNGKDNGGSEALDRCLMHLSFGDVRAIWEKRLADRYALAGSIDCIRLLAEHGARWAPDDAYSMSSVRRELLRCEPRVTVDIVKLLAKYKACPEETLERLLDAPKMKLHLSQLGLQLLDRLPSRR